jgi:hypothetical protein
MSTTARKARKRAGIKFEKAAKVGTPILERAFFTQLVFGPAATKHASRRQPRSAKKIAAALKPYGLNAAA